MALFRDRTRGPELRSLYREIWRLSWPAFVGQSLHSVVTFISRIIIGQLGEKAYNSVNVGMMDGGVKFVTDDVANDVWWAMGTRNCGEAVSQ